MTTRKSKILILYAEVMGYLTGAITEYLKYYNDTEILLIELDKEKLTSYTVDAKGYSYEKKSDIGSYSAFKQKCIKFNPDLLLASGRMDKDYLKVAHYFKNKGVYTVTLHDTKYVGSLRQSIIGYLSWWLYRRNFNGFWGSGSPQAAFGYRLGFSKENIFEGFLTADTNIFKPRKKTKLRTPNKTFLYVGRLSEEKNLISLIRAIEGINDESNMQHQLLLVGDGPCKDAITKYKSAKIISFQPPTELMKLAENTDAFCLASTRDAWGVVIHEFACVGLPLLISKNCGAVSEFLIDGYNGFSFDPMSIQSIKNSLNKFIDLSEDEVNSMEKRSIELSQRISTRTWAATLRAILYKTSENK